METNPLTQGFIEVRKQIDHSQTVWFTNPRLRRIIRLRLVSDPGHPYWDLSYCYGQMDDGTYVRVQLPRQQFRKSRLRIELVDMCKEYGVYAKGLGLLDSDVISTLT